MTRLTDEKRRLIKDLREGKWSYAAIGKLVGLSRQRVHQICTDKYVPDGKKKTLEERVIFWHNERGWSIYRVAKKYGLDIFQVRKILGKE